MKKLVSILSLIFAVTTLNAESSVAHLLVQLRTLTAIEGPAVYYAGIPGRFSLLVPYFQNWASDEEVTAMLTDKSPVVRIMGYQCALLRKQLDLEQQMRSLEKDSAEIDYFPFGCVGGKATVGVIVCDLKKNPRLLTELPKVLDSYVEDITGTYLPIEKKGKAPNQAPTSTAVTPPASAGDRASGTRGSP
jgi:hypothetical protein